MAHQEILQTLMSLYDYRILDKNLSSGKSGKKTFIENQTRAS